MDKQSEEYRRVSHILQQKSRYNVLGIIESNRQIVINESGGKRKYLTSLPDDIPKPLPSKEPPILDSRAHWTDFLVWVFLAIIMALAVYKILLLTS